MLNWDKNFHKDLKISEILGILENEKEPTLRDIEVLGLYWFFIYGKDFLHLRKSLQELSETSKYPFCSGHNIMTTYMKEINPESKLDEDYFNSKLKELVNLNRSEFLIETIHKTYYLIKTFQLQ